MKRNISILFVILFLGLCLVPFLGMFWEQNNRNSEKRQLAKLPSLFTDQGINSDITKQYDNYFTDNFAFRSELITLHAIVYAGFFGQSVSDQVIIGKNGWLFFEPTVDDYTRTNTLSDNEIYRTYRTLLIQKMYLDKKNIHFIFTVAPNKASLYGDYMPDRYLLAGENNNFEKLSGVLEEQKFDYVNLHEILSDGTVPLYHKLDTHWNNMGAMLAYNSLLSRVSQWEESFVYDTHQELVPQEVMSWNGDLSQMLYPTAKLLDRQYIFEIQKEYSARRPIKSMEDLTIQTSCSQGSLNLLMFRDSFANALIPIMSNEFASATYSRAVPYDYSQIEAGTDVVILEIAERNLENIIAEAPILPSFQVELEGSITPVSLETTVSIDEQGQYFHVFGIAVPPDYQEETNYDIYIRLQSEDKVYTFVTFPILENNEESASDDKANAAFSMLIDSSSLPEGIYTLTAVLCDQAGHMISDVTGASISIAHSEE